MYFCIHKRSKNENASTISIPSHLLIAITSWVQAQEYTANIQPVEQDENLTGNRVNAMLQDQDGYVWMLTQDGLARFDGYNYKWFNKANSALRDIPKPNQLVEDEEGYIWLNQYSNIDLLHRKTFEVVRFEDKFKTFIQTTFGEKKFSIKKLLSLENNSILISLEVRGEPSKVYQYDVETGIKEVPVLRGKDINLGIIRKNEVWASNKKQWIKYNLTTGEILNQFKDTRKLKFVYGSYLPKDLFYTAKGKDILIYEAKGGELVEFLKIGSDFNKKSANKTRVFYDDQSNLLIISLQDGLAYYDLSTKKLAWFQTFQKTNYEFIARIYIKDNNNNLWGINRNGVQVIKITTSKFKSYFDAGIQSRGIWISDDFISTNRFIQYFDNPNTYTALSPDRMIAPEPNIKDELWKATEQGIVSIYSKDGIIHPPVLFSKNTPKNKTKSSWTILRDKEGRWWNGSFGDKGLVVSHKEHRDSLYEYKQYNEFKTLAKSNIIHLVEDGAYIWAASNSGLYLIHKEKGVVQRYASNMPEAYQLPLDNVFYIYKDADNVFWAATNADGLIRFELDKDKKVTQYKRYSTEDGLSSNVIYAIIEDDKSRLWMSTLNGLSCFIKATEKIQTYHEVDGLPATEFNRAAYATGPDGRIYFGSISGVVAFHPDDIFKKSDKNTALTITKFSKYEKKSKKFIDYTQALTEKTKIRLLPSDGAISLSISSLDYFNTKNQRYAYKINGLFDEFQFVDGNPIEISSLPYGRFKLIVNIQGTDGQFSDEELVIPIIVVRPFYLKWWFLLIVGILGIITGIQFYSWRIRRLEERKRELELLVKERTAQIQKDKTIIEQDKATIEKDKAIIEEQAIQLRELDELKSKFFANISHELRTPLTLILGPLNTVIQRNQLSNQDATYLQMMRQNGQKLLKRINELLDLSRLDANRIEVKEQAIFLYPFFKTLLSTFESAANIKDIQLLFKYELDENTQVLTDEDKLEKIVTNYLSNALKFTPKNGTITLKTLKNNRKLQISVADTGIGILPNDLIKIFDRFYQTKTEKQAQGTGIGLSLCQELAKVLNGRVWTESQIDQGSTFYLELSLVETFALKKQPTITEETPIVPIAAEPIPATNQPIHKKFRPTILIVEDNPDLRNYLTMILQEDYNVETAENGQEALGQLRVAGYELRVDANTSNPQPATCNPQLIISDIMMPVMDGIELVTHLKNDKKLQHIPIVMLTARQSLEVKIDALRIGVDDYLTKPFREEELKARVSNLIKNSLLRQSQIPNQKGKTDKQIRTTMSAADLKWLAEVEQFILNNIENSDYKLKDVAPDMALSYSGFIRKIKRVTGLTPKQYERSVKLNRAREILKSGDVETVTEVMHQLGFDNHFYFSKIYKQEFGIMPTEEL